MTEKEIVVGVKIGVQKVLNGFVVHLEPDIERVDYASVPNRSAPETHIAIDHHDAIKIIGDRLLVYFQPTEPEDAKS